MELSVLSNATHKTGEVRVYSTYIRELEASTFTLSFIFFLFLSLWSSALGASYPSSR